MNPWFWISNWKEWVELSIIFKGEELTFSALLAFILRFYWDLCWVGGTWKYYFLLWMTGTLTRILLHVYVKCRNLMRRLWILDFLILARSSGSETLGPVYGKKSYFMTLKRNKHELLRMFNLYFTPQKIAKPKKAFPWPISLVIVLSLKFLPAIKIYIDRQVCRLIKGNSLPTREGSRSSAAV